MKNNATNREVLKITSKEILLLDISDENAVRQKSQEYIDELLEMPMDSKTEKNLKSFKEKMKGNCPADIQFSSVAPATGIEGETDHVDNDDQAQSDNDEDMDGSSDLGGTNDDGEKSSNNENIEGDKQTELTDDGQSESNDSTSEPSVQNQSVGQTSNGKKKRLLTKDPITPGKEIYYTSREV